MEYGGSIMGGWLINELTSLGAAWFSYNKGLKTWTDTFMSEIYLLQLSSANRDIYDIRRHAVAHVLVYDYPSVREATLKYIVELDTQIN